MWLFMQQSTSYKGSVLWNAMITTVGVLTDIVIKDIGRKFPF